jgi:peptidoglycan/LPS O-acetylase OafA/YrhL
MTVAAGIYQSKFATNFLRMLLALLVIYSHSYVLGGYGEEPAVNYHFNKYTLGSLAVAVFFGLSGYMITYSALRSSYINFISSRFFRIVPAYLTVLLFTAFLLAPTIYFIDGGTLQSFFVWSNGPFYYFLKNMYFPSTLEPEILNIFAETPFGKSTGIAAINGSLWTLPLEVRCYLISFFVIFCKKLILQRLYFFVIFVTLSGLLFYSKEIQYLSTAQMHWALNLSLIYVAGGLFATFADRLQAPSKVLLTLFFTSIATAIVGGIWFEILTLAVFPIILILLCTYLPKTREDLKLNDYSYGLYIYGWIVLQSVIFFMPDLSHLEYLFVTLILTFCIAWLSWHFIEKPTKNFNQNRIIRKSKT